MQESIRTGGHFHDKKQGYRGAEALKLDGSRNPLWPPSFLPGMLVGGDGFKGGEWVNKRLMFRAL